MKWRLKNTKDQTSKNWFLEKTSKIEKSSAKLSKRRKEKIPINKTRERNGMSPEILMEAENN
jgi:hypothetical protein